MDWKKIIVDLAGCGMTQAEIAAKVGVKQPTIAGILAGVQKDMRWSNGEKLIRLHRRTLRKARASGAAHA